MIELHSTPTPNGQKVMIMLEECGLEWNHVDVSIRLGEQFTPKFLALSPNNKIPAIVDRDNGRRMMESGAILLYLAEKTGQFLPAGESARWEAIEWLMWQMGGAGPMLGQIHHFVKFNPDKSDYASDRYLTEGKRLYGVLDKRLDGRDFVAGDYSVADMAIWPWISRFEWQTIDLNEFPNVKEWYVRIANRPAVEKGYHVPKYQQDIPMP